MECFSRQFKVTSKFLFWVLFSQQHCLDQNYGWESIVMKRFGTLIQILVHVFAWSYRCHGGFENTRILRAKEVNQRARLVFREKSLNSNKSLTIFYPWFIDRIWALDPQKFEKGIWEKPKPTLNAQICKSVPGFCSNF